MLKMIAYFTWQLQKSNGNEIYNGHVNKLNENQSHLDHPLKKKEGNFLLSALGINLQQQCFREVGGLIARGAPLKINSHLL